jgi:hypothetical protein
MSRFCSSFISPITPSWFSKEVISLSFPVCITHVPLNTNSITLSSYHSHFLVFFFYNPSFPLDPQTIINASWTFPRTSISGSISAFKILDLPTQPCLPSYFGADPDMESSHCLSFTQIPPTQGICVWKMLLNAWRNRRVYKKAKQPPKCYTMGSLDFAISVVSSSFLTQNEYEATLLGCHFPPTS